MVRTREIQGPTHQEKFTIHEFEDVYDSSTGRAMTGSWVWDSALLLSLFISSSSSSSDIHLQGKTVLELGAGTGLPALTASRLGASQVILTDLAPLLPGLLNNVEANGLVERVEVCELEWGSDELPSQLTELSCTKGGVDLVLMSDVFYDPSLMEALAKTLKMVCRRDTKIWASTEVRDSATECITELARLGFEATELTCRPRSEMRALEVDKEDDDRNYNDMLVVYLITPSNGVL